MKYFKYLAFLLPFLAGNVKGAQAVENILHGDDEGYICSDANCPTRGIMPPSSSPGTCLHCGSDLFMRYSFDLKVVVEYGKEDPPIEIQIENATTKMLISNIKEEIALKILKGLKKGLDCLDQVLQNLILIDSKGKHLDEKKTLGDYNFSISCNNMSALLTSIVFCSTPNSSETKP